MADTITRTRNEDPYGFTDSRIDPTPVATPVDGPPVVAAPMPTTDATPAATEEKVGSPLNTLYGVDNESYLTEDQRKLMRQIQGKFDASLSRRDRALAQYGAPMLSSYMEDEALARAIAGAQGLNYRPPENPVEDKTPGPTRPYNTGGLPRGPGDDSTGNRQQTGAQTNAEWQRILSGLASIAPLLFGKDAWGQFMNKGLIQTVKEAIFGKDAAYMPDASFEAIVKAGVLPTDPSGQFILNPITGLPMIANPNAVSTETGYTPEGGGYGPEPEWGYTPPTEADWGVVDDPWAGWEGGDWGVPDFSNWWDFSGGSGGDYVDLFGGV